MLVFSSIFLVASKPAFCQAPDIEWQKALGGTSVERAYSVQQTADGGYIVAGTSESTDGDITGAKGGGDAWVVKLSSTGTVEWKRNYGGSLFDEARSIQQTPADGGYIFAGSTASNNGDVIGNHNTDGSTDFWLVKLKANGDIIWQRCYGGSYDDKAMSVKLTGDGGYIAAGSTFSNDDDVTGNHAPFEGFSADYWVIKVNNGGILTWQRTLGGAGEDNAKSVIQTSDGGYVVLGDVASADGDVTDNHGGTDIWMAKLSSNGQTIALKKSFGGTLAERGNYIKQTADLGYIIAGQALSTNGDLVNSGNHGAGDCWLLKITANGAISWQKAYGGSSNDEAFSIEPTTDAGYIVAAYTNSTNGDISGAHLGGEMWAYKINATGALSWQRPMGGKSQEQGFSAMQAIDGGYIIAGESNSNDGDVTNLHGTAADAWVVKLKTTVTPLTLLSFNAVRQNNKVQLTWLTTNEQNTLDFTIERSYDGITFTSLTKVNALGNSNREHTYNSSDEIPLNGKNYYRLKSTDKDGNFTRSIIVQVIFNKDGSITIIPNPVKSSLNILWQNASNKNAVVQITDISGKVVLNKKVALQAGENNIKVPVQSLPAGTYMARMVGGDEIKVLKFIKE